MQVFQFADELANDLLAVVDVFLGFAAFELLAGTTDGKAVFIQQATNLTNHDHVVTLVIASVAASFYRFKLGKFLLPVSQHMRLNATQLADFTNGEVAFAGNHWEFVIAGCFQHTLRP